MEKKERIIYLDMLKIISCIFVVIIHVTAPGFRGFKLNSLSWDINLLFNMLARFAVPVFVMVSGALFLDKNKEIDIKRLWKKNILHLFVLYILWTIIYSVYNVYSKGFGFNIKNILVDCIKSSYYHLWFIPMIIGLYMIVPIIRPFTKDKRLLEYFIVLFFVLKIIPYTLDLFNVSVIHKILQRMSIAFLSFDGIFSFAGYFIIGHYINEYGIKKRNRILIYIIGILSYILGVVGTILFSNYKNKAYETFDREFSITTFFMSIAMFTLFKYITKNKVFKEKTEKIIIHLSKMTLGIYVIHALFIDILKNQVGLSFTKLYNLPLAFLIVIIVSYIFTYIFSKIPIVKKYLV